MRYGTAALLSACMLLVGVDGFTPSRRLNTSTSLNAAQGFGASKKNSKKSNRSKRGKGNLLTTIQGDDSSSRKKKVKKGGFTYNKSESDALLQQLAATSSLSPIGRVVASSPLHGTPEADPFWELMPSLISSKFPKVKDHELERIAGFVKHALDPNLPLEQTIIDDPWRPHDEIHAWMPGLGDTEPFHDPSQLELCRRLSENIDVIEQEYEALLLDMKNGKDRFQSVTSMNYDSGWKTLVLFYNGHRIDGFPYHLCPVTTAIMESVPLAGRIAGFNRQSPGTGIPLHSDGNNMWLTCQMGLKIPEGQKAYIKVGDETRRWERGECLLYDTTYKHETMNESDSEERVVLHVDFFNTLKMTDVEIQIMQYIYSIREGKIHHFLQEIFSMSSNISIMHDVLDYKEFMKAEGVAKVGNQIL